MAGSSSTGPLVAGVDLATADARVVVASGSGRVVARGRARLAPPQRPEPGVSEQDARSWWPAVAKALSEAVAGAPGSVISVAVSATSGTVVLADAGGDPVGPALLYDDGRVAAADRWDWLLDRPWASDAALAWHASDLIVAHLTGIAPPTDWSHALKTGYDPDAGRWASEGRAAALRPRTVLGPGSLAGTVNAAAAAECGLPAGCEVRLGMTDGCAAQLAAGADRPGRFVTVLGTTLVVKGASEARVDDGPSGIYSHRHPGGWWLPGGASNVGGGSLRRHFADRDLAALDRDAATRGPATVVSYPLPRTGERFPFAAPEAEELWPDGRPADDVEAYRAVLEGVAFVERMGYERLAALGAEATPPVRTAGGGSASPVWSSIRATVLGVPVTSSASAETAFGACILAAAGTVHESVAAATDAMVPAPEPPTEPVAAERAQMDESYHRFVEAVRDRGWVRWPG
jgi:sugar (pentulose or hexulose) kinase